MPMPAADFLYSSPYDALIGTASTGGYVGRETVDGVAASHVAYQHPSVDWDLWVPSRAIRCRRGIASPTRPSRRRARWKSSFNKWRLGRGGDRRGICAGGAGRLRAHPAGGPGRGARPPPRLRQRRNVLGRQAYERRRHDIDLEDRNTCGTAALVGGARSCTAAAEVLAQARTARRGAAVKTEEGGAAVGRRGAAVKTDEGAAAVTRRGAAVKTEEGVKTVPRYGAPVPQGGVARRGGRRRGGSPRRGGRRRRRRRGRRAPWLSRRRGGLRGQRRVEGGGRRRGRRGCRHRHRHDDAEAAEAGHDRRRQQHDLLLRQRRRTTRRR